MPILQITNVEESERYYMRHGEGVTAYAPSWTHILSTSWPASKQLEQWRGDVGNERAEQIMNEAGEQGTFVHNSCEALMKGEWIASDDVRRSFPRGKALHPLRCIQAFVGFCEEFEPWPMAIETTTWLDDPAAAGTIDFLGTINRPVKKGSKIVADKSSRVYALLDWKSSKSLHDNHKAQVAGYAYSEKMSGCPPEYVGLLHLGNTTKAKWSLCGITDDIDRWTELALLAAKTFHLHHPNAAPSLEQFPEVFTLKTKEPVETEDVQL